MKTITNLQMSRICRQTIYAAQCRNCENEKNVVAYRCFHILYLYMAEKDTTLIEDVMEELRTQIICVGRNSIHYEYLLNKYNEFKEMTDFKGHNDEKL